MVAFDSKQSFTGSTRGTPGEEIRGEYDYVLNYLDIIAYNGQTYSFLGHFAKVTYEESIFTLPHGSITVVDAVDYYSLLPLIGEEKIRASFTRQDETARAGEAGRLLPSLDFEMWIYAMTGRNQDQGSRKRQIYTLNYISEGAFKNTTQRVFSAYKGKLYSDIVEEIHNQYITHKPIEVEKTMHQMNYLIQNERPITAIKKIAHRALSAESTNGIPNGSFFCYYEDTDRYYFTTVSKLFQRSPKIDIRFDVKNSFDDGSGQGPRDKQIEKDIYNIDYFHNESPFDVLASIQSGEGGGTLITIDPLRKKYKKTEYSLKDNFDKQVHIDRSKPFTENSRYAGAKQAIQKLIITNSEQNTNANFSADEEIFPTFLEEVKLVRDSQKAQILKNSVKVTMSGDPRIRAGDVINFLMPEMLGKTSKENPEELSAYFQGKYLVLGVSHEIKPTSYKMNLELIKDTFFSNIEHRDPVEEYKNIK
jgi:hypothetical protein